jgi:hypothetical protein
MVTKTLVLACLTNSSALMTVVGVGASKPLLMMREDDTVTDSTLSGVWACAMAGADINMAKTAVLLDSARRRFAQPAFAYEFMIFPLCVSGVSFFETFPCVEPNAGWRISQ